MSRPPTLPLAARGGSPDRAWTSEEPRPQGAEEEEYLAVLRRRATQRTGPAAVQATWSDFHHGLLVFAVTLGLACAGSRGSAPPPAATPGSSALAVSTFAGAGPLTPIATTNNFISLEGPFWVGRTQRLLFSDVVEANGPGAVIYELDPQTRRFTVVPYPPSLAGGPTSTNGLAVDGNGNLLACERYNAQLVRLGANGKLTVLADGWPAGDPARPGSAARKAFNAPNDLAVRRDGNLYFTDSDWGTKPGGDHAPMGVYRLSPRGELSRVMDVEKPNGIALSPDEGALYVGSDVQAKVWRLPVDNTGTPGAPTLFIDGARIAEGFKVPDGICVDDSGNLYITNNADDIKAIVVFDPTGKSLGRIPVPFAPSNCTFGGADRRTLYVTTLHAVYEGRMPIAGLP